MEIRSGAENSPWRPASKRATNNERGESVQQVLPRADLTAVRYICLIEYAISFFFFFLCRF